MITTRDLKVIDFLEEYKIARTTTIQQLFYPSLRVCQRRLKELFDKEEIGRTRIDINTDYMYYVNKPKQIMHSVLVTDFYRELAKQGEILHFKIEAAIENIRPDAVIGYSVNGRNYIAFLEVELSNKGLDLGKYEKFDYSNYFSAMPILYVITDAPIRHTSLNLLRCGTDLQNFRLYV